MKHTSHVNVLLYQHRQVVKTETTNIFIELLNYLVEYKKNTLPRFIIMIDCNLKKKVHRLLVRVAGCMARGARAQQEAGPLLLSWPGFAVPSLVQLPFPRSSGSARVVRGRACVKTASSVTSITDDKSSTLNYGF